MDAERGRIAVVAGNVGQRPDGRIFLDRGDVVVQERAVKGGIVDYYQQGPKDRQYGPSGKFTRFHYLSPIQNLLSGRLEEGRQYALQQFKREGTVADAIFFQWVHF